jgi:hypothetical protein
MPPETSTRPSGSAVSVGSKRSTPIGVMSVLDCVSGSNETARREPSLW